MKKVSMNMNKLLTKSLILILLHIFSHASYAQNAPNVAIPGKENKKPQSAAMKKPQVQRPTRQTQSRPPAPTNHQLKAIGENVDRQARGEYKQLKRKSSPPLGTIQKAWDKPSTSQGQRAPGIINYSWTPNFVMSVRLRDYMTTTVHFPQWEKISSFYVGDPYVFQVQQAQANVLVLRSQYAGADSNFTAIGHGGNVYNFYLRSESWNSKNIPDLTVYVEAPNPTSYWSNAPVNHSGTSQHAFTPNAARQSAIHSPVEGLINIPDYLRQIVFKPENIQFDMKMYADTENDAEIAPERVFHDGIFTYFDYGDRADSVQRPVIFLVNDGVDTMVNTRTTGENGQVIVAEAVGNFTLRNGRKVVCIKREPDNKIMRNSIVIDDEEIDRNNKDN